MNSAALFFSDVRFTIEACAGRGGYTPRMRREDRQRMASAWKSGDRMAARYWRDKAALLSQRARSAKGGAR